MSFKYDAAKRWPFIKTYNCKAIQKDFRRGIFLFSEDACMFWAGVDNEDYDISSKHANRGYRGDFWKACPDFVADGLRKLHIYEWTPENAKEAAKYLSILEVNESNEICNKYAYMYAIKHGIAKSKIERREKAIIKEPDNIMHFGVF